jgi:hypothetical protein
MSPAWLHMFYATNLHEMFWLNYKTAVLSNMLQKTVISFDRLQCVNYFHKGA